MKFYKNVLVKKEFADDSVETFESFGWKMEKEETEGENGAFRRLTFVRDTDAVHYKALYDLETAYRRAETEETALSATLLKDVRKPNKTTAIALGILLILPGVAYYARARRRFREETRNRIDAERKLDALKRRKWELKYEAQRLTGKKRIDDAYGSLLREIPPSA